MRGFKELKIGFPVKLKSEKVEEAKEAVQRFGMKKLEKAKEKEKKPLGKTIKKTVQKAAAVGTAGALILAFVIPFGLSTISHTEKISALNDEPAPITMDISDYDAADITDDGSDEEQEEKKIGFFKRIKMAIYGFFGGIGLFIATKIPWKKIFKKRNLLILLAIIVIGLLVYLLGPVFFPDCPWDYNGHIIIIINKGNA